MVDTYTALQQHKLDALLRYHVAGSTYFHEAREELIDSFAGDERAAYAAFADTLRTHMQDCKRLTAAVERVSLFGADGADMPCGDDGIDESTKMHLEASGASIEASSSTPLNAVQTLLYERFGVVVEPIVSAPPERDYEPNVYERTRQDYALRKHAANSRLLRKVGGVHVGTIQTDSDGSNEAPFW